MRLLLDTHVLLWFILDDPQLSAKADAMITDPNNEIELSSASDWEIAIKISIGKYNKRVTPTQFQKSFFNLPSRNLSYFLSGKLTPG